jgi:dCMP deaminase
LKNPNEKSRVSWDAYFMDIARAVATRATCDRRHVGCVIVKDRRILSTGYNGSMVGAEHCSPGDNHIIRDNHCVRVIHSEINALAQAARFGIAVDGATCYTTTYPCWNCFKTLVNAGIRAFAIGSVYKPDPLVEEHALQANIELRAV